MGYYQVAQVCLNGHLITSNWAGSPELRSNFCSQCGAATVHLCSHCKVTIRGHYHVEGVLGFYETSPPAYCHSCGQPYPWTERAIQAAKDLTDEIEGLDETEKQRAKESFVALASDTPQTTVAVARVKKLLAKAGPVVGTSLREVIVSLATEAAKKGLGL